MGQKAVDIATIGRISAVPAILQVISEMTGLRFAAVARVTDDSWTACAVRDQLDFGLPVGGELDLTTTLCHEIRGSHVSIVIDKASEDPLYRDHHTPRIYHFESYISVPVFRTDGRFFGTICALDPNPAQLRSSTIQSTMESFARVLSLQIEAEESLQQTEADLQQERETAELREQFIAVLGHDLRNPLAAITAGTELMLDTPLNPKAKRLARTILASVARMSGLIADVMDFARGRLGGGLTLNPSTAEPLEPTLRQVIAEARASAPHRSIEAEIALHAAITCDRARIAQLLSNLLGNALDYGAPGTPIKVRATTDATGFELSVANAGDPIPPASLERLFQPFTRGAVRPNQQGLGLGLFIAAEVARAHGGTIGVTSTRQQTRFTFRMPLTSPLAPSAA